MTTPPDPSATYDRLVDDLSYTYEGVFSRETVAEVVHESRTTLEATA